VEHECAQRDQEVHVNIPFSPLIHSSASKVLKIQEEWEKKKKEER
jgi:hypothetical protein